MNNNTIDSNLLFAQVAIENARSNAVIKEALGFVGYDDARMDAGKALYDNAEQKQIQQKKEYGEQYAATDALEASRAIANSVLMRHVKLARIALKNQRGLWQTLELEGRRKRSYSGWIKQAKVFYTNALDSEEIKAILVTMGITEQALTDGLAAVTDVESKLAQQLKEKGEAQEATRVRDEAFDDLDEWMDDFIAVCRIALEDQPQYLEMLGIVKTTE